MQAIKSSLKFKTLNVNNMREIQDYVNRFPVYSDFNAVSLYTWGVNNSTKYCFFNDCLIIKIKDYNTKLDSYSIIGNEGIKYAIQELRDSMSIENLERIPEFAANYVKNEYHLEHQLDEDDYVYTLHDLVNLEGPEYRKFRRSLSNFYTKNSIAPTLRVIKPQDTYDLNQVLHLTRKWRTFRGRSYQSASQEYFAIRKSVHYYSSLPIIIWGLFQEKTLLGFIITENIGNTTLLHFEKANTELPGLGSYLKNAVFYELYKNGQELLNYEQDLGIQGLKEAKKSLNPSLMMRKYRIEI